MDAPSSADDDMLAVHFSGEVSSEQITAILEYIEKRFDEMRPSASVRRKITSVLVEALQNLFHHGAKTGPSQEPIDADRAHSQVVIRREQDNFLIITGNHIPAARARELHDRIRSINAMSRQELNESYRHILQNRLKSSPHGSGVGMIDIARRSGQKITFTMTPVDDDSYYFNMEVRIAP